MNSWLYGFSSSIWAHSIPLRLQILYDAEMRAVISYLQKLEAVIPPYDAKELCQWYVNTLAQVKFIQKENFYFDTEGDWLHVYVRAPCVYREACIAIAKDEIPLVCFRSLAFQSVLDLAQGKKYKQNIKDFSPETQCRICLGESALPCQVTGIEGITSLAVIKIGDIGPEPLMHTEFSFLDNKDAISDFLMRTGIFYSTAVGQGSEGTEGLFGPFPVAEHPNQFAMAYAFRLKDESLKDTRFKGQAYILLIIFYPRTKENLFIRVNLEKVMKSGVSTLGSLDELNNNFIEHLHKSIEKFLTWKTP
ncbi:MAG: hypothetical protein ACFFDT_18940 [Candidatus Hodarchaeota archaeon]